MIKNINDLDNELNGAQKIIDNLYDLIETWKNNGISELTITKTLVFIFPDVVIDTSPDEETANSLLIISSTQIEKALAKYFNPEEQNLDTDNSVH